MTNIGNKGLRRKEQNNFNRKSYRQWGLNLGPQTNNAKLAQSGRRQCDSQEIPGSIPTGGTIIY